MAQTLNYRPKSYPGLLRLTFYLKTRPNWSGHFVLIKKQTQIGPCSSRPIQRFKKGPHIKTEKKIDVAVRRAQTETQARFAQRWMKKSANQIKSNPNKTQRLLVAEILHLRLLLLSLSLLFAFALSVHTAIPPMLNSSGISQNHTLKIHFSLPITRACRFCSGMN